MADLMMPGGGLTKAKLLLANANPSDVSSEKGFYSNGSKELQTGTLIERGTSQNAGGIGSGGSGSSAYIALNKIPEGIYRSNGESWAPEIRMPKTQVVSGIPWSNKTVYYSDSGDTNKNYSTTVYPGYLYLGVVVTRRTDGDGGDASLNVTNSTVYVNLTFDSSTNNSYHKAITKVCLFRPVSNGTFSASCTGGNGWVKNMIGLYRLE